MRKEWCLTHLIQFMTPGDWFLDGLNQLLEPPPYDVPVLQQQFDPSEQLDLSFVDDLKKSSDPIDESLEDSLLFISEESNNLLTEADLLKSCDILIEKKEMAEREPLDSKCEWKQQEFNHEATAQMGQNEDFLRTLNPHFLQSQTEQEREIQAYEQIINPYFFLDSGRKVVNQFVEHELKRGRDDGQIYKILKQTFDRRTKLTSLLNLWIQKVLENNLVNQWLPKKKMGKQWFGTEHFRLIDTPISAKYRKGLSKQQFDHYKETVEKVEHSQCFNPKEYFFLKKLNTGWLFQVLYPSQ
jgi:hypothetical protein